MALPSTVYVVCIDGKLLRLVARNPDVLLAEIKKDIKKRFIIDYDFDLTYNGQEISETLTLADIGNGPDSSPFVVRKNTEQARNKYRTERKISSFRSRIPPSQKPASTDTYEPLFKDLFEEVIEDETESKNETSLQLTEACQRKPTMVIHVSPVMPVEEQHQ